MKCLVNVFRRISSYNRVTGRQRVDSFETTASDVVESLEKYSKESAGSVVKLDPLLEFEIVDLRMGFPVVYLEPGREKFHMVQA